MLLLFITDELPRPGIAGHLTLNHAIVTWAQSEGHELRILLTGTRLPAPVVHYPGAPVCGPHILNLNPFLLPKTPRALAIATARALHLKRRARQTAILGTYTSPADAAWCAAYAKKHQPGAILIDTIFRSPVIKALQPTDIKTIIITHDVFHRRHAALTAAGYHVEPADLTAATEAAALALAGHAAAIQPDEAALITAMRAGRSTFLLPMPATPCPATAPRQRNRLVFTGSASLPNLDGMRWFLTDIWPLLPPGISLDIIGDAGPALGRVPSGVTIHGRVKNLAPLLHQASLAISPLRAGSGLKIKLLDYASHGLTTIATPCSTEGFPPEAAPFISADTASAFAAAIQHALYAPPPDAAALAYITKHYGVTASFAGLHAALHCDITIT